MRNGRWLGWLGGALACAMLACGSGDADKPAPTAPMPAATPAAPPATAPSAPASLEERLAALASLYEWDAARGEARALDADVRECNGQVQSEGLVGVAEHIRCMEALGWTRKPGA